MESPESNQLLTQVGADAPMGQLLRRYWQPFMAASELHDKWTRPVRLLGEDLVLYRDQSGQRGLVARNCPHRGASLLHGIPTERGLRCPYHGWEFNAQGQCLHQPFESDNPGFRQRVGIAGYAVQELGGLLWAYLGPLPAPLLPRFDGFVVDGAIRMLGRALLPVNWLQVMENSLDPVHTEWLHGHQYEFQRAQEGVKVAISASHERIDFREFEFGITKHRLLQGHAEDSDDWRIGHPIVFPNTLAVGNGEEGQRYYSFQLRVPVDGQHTLHLWYNAYMPPAGSVVAPHLTAKLHTYDVPFRDAQGEFIMNNIDGQDMMAWITQGAVADRTRENLAASDKGVAQYRRMLKRELRKIEQGEEPMGLLRDAARNTCIELPNEKKKHHNSDGFASFMLRTHARYSPIAADLVDLFETQPRQRAAQLGATHP